MFVPKDPCAQSSDTTVLNEVRDRSFVVFVGSLDVLVVFLSTRCLSTVGPPQVSEVQCIPCVVLCYVNHVSDRSSFVMFFDLPK